MARIVLQPAFVLHRRPYRNTSLLLEILSRDAGRLGLVARGARRLRSPWRGLLEPFRPLLLSWSGRGEVPTLTAAEEAAPLPALPPPRLYSGLYVNELLLRLLGRHAPHPELFAAYRGVVEALAESAEEPALRLFEKRLLAELGYGLLLHVEALTGRPIAAADAYRYVPEQGPVAAAQSRIGLPISGRSLLAFGRDDLTDPMVLREVKRLTRMAIAAHLQGQPLHTRRLLAAGIVRGKTLRNEAT